MVQAPPARLYARSIQSPVPAPGEVSASRTHRAIRRTGSDWPMPKSIGPISSSDDQMQIAGQGHVAAIIAVEARMRMLLRAHAPCPAFIGTGTAAVRFWRPSDAGHGWLIVKIADPRVRATRQ